MKPGNRAVACFLLFFFLSGCGKPSTTASDDATDLLALFGQLYAQYLAANNGAAPPNEESLKRFLEPKTEGLSQMGIASVDDLLRSPRDNEPLVIRYDKEKLVEGPGGLPWVAHERVGVEGQRYAIGGRGSVELMNEDEINKAFP